MTSITSLPYSFSIAVRDLLAPGAWVDSSMNIGVKGLYELIARG